MAVLNNKIDFTVLVRVQNANPNGDPLGANMPRTNYQGYGEISDVCIKRKIRNRLMDNGNYIFVQSDENTVDGYSSLSERASEELKGIKNRDEYAQKACEKWIDVRTFGQVFAFKGLSVGVRGPVSIQQAVSCSPVGINSMKITKSVNSEPSDKDKSSDTMGTKYFVEFGLYRINGSINVQHAEKTGFSEEDAEQVKEALRTLFINDASSARPDGSMEVVKVYWWKHNNKIGQYSAAKVHSTLNIKLKDGISLPNSVNDYEIELNNLDNLVPEIIEGM